MSWFALIVLSVIIVSFSNIAQRVLMRDDKSDAVTYTQIFALLLSIVNFAISLMFGFKLPTLGFNLIYFLAAAILWGMGTIYLFKALQLIESSEVTILMSLRVLISILAAIIFLQETFSLQKLVGTVILLISIALIGNIKKGVKFNKGLFYTFIATVFYGIAIAFDAFNLKNYDVISYLPIINFTIFVLLLIIYPKSIKKWKQFAHTDFLKKMFLLVLFSNGQAYAYYFALQKGNLSQIAPINQAQVIVTVLFAAILLKERDHLIRKVISAVLVTIGVFLLL